MALYKWNEMPKELLSATLARQVIHGEQTTIARIYLQKDAVVPRHHHHNEQITTLESGQLRFVFDDQEVVLHAGESLVIAPNAPHEVIALEDSVALDVFSPAREDWRRGDDAYLRR